MELPVWFEIATFVGLTVLLLADLAIVARRPHEPSVKEATLWVSFYVALALLFGLVILAVTDGQFATEFYAGWLTEYSLSVDNLFVFVIIMARFQVPRKLQQEALMVGIIIALVLRGIFILLGAAVIERFTWVFYIFGAFLVYTAINLVRHRGEEDEYEENAFIRRMRKVLPITQDYHGSKIRVTENGKKFWTPMIVVFLALGTTDLLFALDSIPAIFGLTKEPFIVFTANVFALMGLRQLYFLLGGLLKRLVYLSLGLAVILAFIGVKLVMEALHTNELPFINGGEHIEWVPEIPIWLSLTIILGVLVVATVASLHEDPGRAPRRRPAGRSRMPPAAARREAAAESRGGTTSAPDEERIRGSASVGGHAAERPRAPAHPRRPGRLPGRPDGGGRRHAARPGGRRVPQPAVGGADRRVGRRPPADLRPPRQRAGLLPGRSLAGLPQRRAGASARRSGCCPPPGARRRRLTDHHLGAGAPVWSPDSRRLAYVARVPEQGRYGTVDGVGPGAEPPRLITTLKYRRDAVGFLARPAQPGLRARPAGGLRRRHRARCRSPCR